ncbi:hypothetical protein BSTEL_1225 [Bifidobacterium stellenboschense]|uniref:Uncharacterized protein n=1 Tax=Bifidobacterium stellenboschense TaxID=762211 RepID=A0A087DGA5_9BIFI|nr:hypothetical protein BSTEL_1225 [Bifidobacterium stellenboschense]
MVPNPFHDQVMHEENSMTTKHNHAKAWFHFDPVDKKRPPLHQENGRIGRRDRRGESGVDHGANNNPFPKFSIGCMER